MSKRSDLAHAIRFLSMDAVQQANSGHPGAPMGMADIAQVLWADFLKHNPTHPQWADRDRFVLSNGHGSMLLYALLHLTGYDLSLEELKNFRQLHSKTPGHPESTLTPGVETTTGPLGQGLSNAVGMAIAEKHLASIFNKDHYKIVDHYTYVFLGDGCLMEGISHEACSLAGTLGLGKLIAFWDDNKISIDGDVKGWFTDDTVARFKAYGWQVIADVDGHDPEAIKAAIIAAQKVSNQPTLICCKTIIGFGAPSLAGSEKTHGSPLGATEIAAAREHLNWPHAPFVVPEEIYGAWDAKEKGKRLEQNWDAQFAEYATHYPELAAEFKRRMHNELPANWHTHSHEFIMQSQQAAKKMATRKASQACINAYAPLLPELFGGSADLTGSNCTDWANSVPFTATKPEGNYLHYGVREFGMSAIMNGISLHGGLRPFGGTFLTFTDYARNAVRMAALMQQPVIFVYTHDSIGLGEDGPTHQPVEHVALLRLTPNMSVWRPCDATEAAVAWKMALESTTTPSSLLFSRQDLTPHNRDAATVAAIAKGGYILEDCAGTPQTILIATGSEVELAVAAAQTLRAAGFRIRVVSMPNTFLFDKQSAAYKEQVLPAAVTARVAVEAGVKDFWYKYVGLKGAIIALDRYGESAPYQAVYAELGLTEENIVITAKKLINEVGND